jgi:ABC-type transporter Mla subunit MlaD
MSEYRRNLGVGLFAITGVVVLGVLMIKFGEAPSWLGGHEYPISIQMKWLGGISIGSGVFMNGVQVGRVGDLRFADLDHPEEGVFIDVYVQSGYPIPSSATAIVKPAGLGIGRGYVDLRVSPGIALPPLKTDGTAVIEGEMSAPFGDIIPPEMLDAFQRTVTHVGDFAQALTPVAEDLHDLLQRRTVEDIESGPAPANLATVVQRFDITLQNVNDVIGDPQVQSGLRQAVVNIQDASVEIKDAAANFRALSANLKTDEQRLVEQFDNTLQEVTETARTAVTVLNATAQVATNLQSASRDLAEGKGTLGLLLRDPKLYEGAQLFFARLTEAADMARRILGRFERQGYIEFAAHETAVGTVRGKREVGK